MQICAIEALNGGISIINAIAITHHQHSQLAYTHPSNMTVVLNDPSLWPTINSNLVYSCCMVAAGVVVVYDWVLTLRQEIELIWRQPWSLMTMLYVVVRTS
ncbi:uncharacterized protein F5147DRAFT_770324 [Suillus discolor]|uniref:DUF6533 domain-containing protein n=1 Tax=Suillus discolor TaxID=1912936 RepID=A0A9P7FCQ7_9AGAM|nr:uncharacterized protein F5147DRAFT_770324 [Suillus discolor]KAG2114338.1 hypothetical protein F5147DRAFT_770324 [Suillus discolor]